MNDILVPVFRWTIKIAAQVAEERSVGIVQDSDGRAIGIRVDIHQVNLTVRSVQCDEYNVLVIEDVHVELRFHSP